MFSRFLFLTLCGFLFLASPVSAEDPPHRTTARLFSTVKGVDNLKSVRLGLEIVMEPGWKTYWRTPGEAGLAPVFDWAGSENLKSAAIQWPAPMRFSAFDIDNFGYEGTVVFPIDAVIQTPGQPLALNLKLDLLVCNNICIPEQHRLTLTVPAKEAIVSPDMEILTAAAGKIPLTDPAVLKFHNVWLSQENDNKTYLNAIAITPHAFGADADMFVEATPFISVGKPSVSYDLAEKRLQLQAPVRSEETFDTLQKKLAQAPLTLTITDGSIAFEARFQTSDSVAPPQPLTEKLATAAAHLNINILFLAFLGGLILNLMPCVLPVLSLKVLSVLSHGGKDHRIHRKAIFRNFMASAAGIIFSFLILAAGLAALKITGRTLGWGIQFQHPGFLIFMITVLLFFSANLWGFFEIQMPRFVARNVPAEHAHEPTLFGHFLSGAFATLLATPCTAPFLGTAIGFALASAVSDIFIVFTAIGLGLAFPHIVLALSPRLFKYMPKPGRWMVILKKILGGALALTAAWLINVLVTVSTQATLDDGWTTFNEALIRPAVEDGRTVIVDVTADWCLTCKANKRLVLDQKDVEEALFAPNILRLQADWTQRSEAISTFMRKYGRYGIPFNIVYGPGAPDGIILSELLTKQEIMRALTEAAGE